MKRFLLNSLAVLLGVVALAAIIFCARGMVSPESLTASKQALRYTATTQDGFLLISRTRITFESDALAQQWRDVMDPSRTAQWNQWRWWTSSGGTGIRTPDARSLGFSFERSSRSSMMRRIGPGITAHRLILCLPFWFVILFTGWFPAWRLWKRIRMTEVRSVSGHCTHCGLDLQGVYHHCPKCGTRQPLPDGFPVHSWSS